MARSPVMHLFLRVLRSLRGARAAGVPLAEYVEMEAEARGVSRRRFLEASAAGAGLAVAGGSSFLAGCAGDDSNPGGPGGGGSSGSDASTDASGARDGTVGSDTGPVPEGGLVDAGASLKVAIVGAGIAGLHCAYRLRKLGLVAHVYEASEKLGGRIQTDTTTFPEGMHAELGGELIDTGHTTMHGLATELGIELYDYSGDAAPDGGVIADLVPFFGGKKLSAQDIVAGFGPIATKIDAALAALTNPDNGVTYHDANGGDALDALSLHRWLDSIGAAGPVRDFVELAYTTEYGLEPDVNNVLNLMFLINTDTSGGFQLYGDSDERFHTKTGNHTYIEKLAAGLASGQITMGAMLKKVAKASDGRYVLSFDSSGTSFQVTAERVVLAIPFTTLRDVDTTGIAFPYAKRKAIDELGYGQNAKLMVGFGSKPWRDQGSTGETFTDLPFQSTWETSRMQPGASGIITCFTGGEIARALGNGTSEAQRDTFLGYWDTMFPGAKAASNGKVVRAFWPGNPLTKGSYAAYLVGQYTTICGAEGEAFENLHFCGEHTSLEAQGYMEGGAESGARVAGEIATALGLGESGMWRPRRRLFVPASMDVRYG